MSIFDPQKLYIRRQNSTKKGQVIQKRPVERASAYTDEDLKTALKVLAAFPHHRIGRTLNFNCVTVNSGFFVFSETVLKNNSIYLTVNNILSNISNSDQLWSQMNDVLDASRGTIGPFQIVVLIRHMTYKLELPYAFSSFLHAYTTHSIINFPDANYSTTFDASGSLTEQGGDQIYASFWKNATQQLTMQKQENPAQGDAWVSVSVVNQGTLDKTGSVTYSVHSVVDSTRSAFLDFFQSHQVPDEANDRLVTVTYENTSLPDNATGEIRLEIAYDVIIEGSMTI